MEQTANAVKLSRLEKNVGTRPQRDPITSPVTQIQKQQTNN